MESAGRGGRGWWGGRGALSHSARASRCGLLVKCESIESQKGTESLMIMPKPAKPTQVYSIEESSLKLRI